VRKEWLDFFSTCDKFPRKVRNIVSFQFACLLNHEMAHLFWRTRFFFVYKDMYASGDYPGLSRLNIPEPKDPDNDDFHEACCRPTAPCGELGWAWAADFFGGCPLASLPLQEQGMPRIYHKHKKFDFYISPAELETLFDETKLANMEAFVSVDAVAARRAADRHGFTTFWHLLDLEMSKTREGIEWVVNDRS
jgi:hypothetical protein